MAETLRPLTRICPEVGTSSRKIIRSSVVLPAPLAPVRKTNCPRGMSNVTSSRAAWPPGYRLLTWKNWIKTKGRRLLPDRLLLQGLPHELLHRLRLGAAARALHHLADQEADHLHLAGPVLRHLRGILL